MLTKRQYSIIIVAIAALALIIVYRNYKINQLKQQALPVQSAPTTEFTIPTYQAVSFTALNIPGLSKNQLDQHLELYKGYVNKRNEIAKKLSSVNRSDANNRTYSEYRGLKLAETFAGNGDTLHRLYFENLSNDEKKSQTIGPRMQALLEHSFGSLDAFKKDFFDAGNSAHGWVLTAYCLDDGTIHNYLLEAHNLNVPVLVIPLLVLDVYEHAYMIDFGIKRVPYLDVFWNNINWSVVEDRIAKWVDPLK